MGSQKRKIWVFAFEYSGIAKVGGLGEVSANQSRCLANDKDLDLEVFMPSHGRHRDLKEKMDLKPLLKPDGSKLVLRGHFDPAYFGINPLDVIHATSFSKFQSIIDVGYFEIEVWHGQLEGVSINLLVGVNPIAVQVLNDRDVYAYATLNTKLGLFSHAMREFIRYCISKDPSRIPEVINFHDHHPLAAFLCCRQELNLIGRDVRSIITMHLLTWPRRELDFYWKAGVNNELMQIQIGKTPENLRMRDIFDLCKDSSKEPPSLEKVGCIIADKVIAVSENFLKSDIIPLCGGDLIAPKANFIWNGCDWEYDKLIKEVYTLNNSMLPDIPSNILHSWDLRAAFLTKILGKLPDDEPKFENRDIQQAVASEFIDKPYYPNCHVDAFESDGPLITITGRVSPQKGVENIFNTFSYVIEKFPNVRFVFLLMPTPYTLHDLRSYMPVARKYPENVRMIFGIAGSIYKLAYLASDIYCCPSRWEPFGITALEAMCARVPVVATYVGGLMESVLHLEKYPESGTGLLCPNNDSEALKYALCSLLSTMTITEMKTKNPSLQLVDMKDLLALIVHPTLKRKVEENMLFGEQIRKNSYQRIETYFRWATVTQKLKKFYLEL